MAAEHQRQHRHDHPGPAGTGEALRLDLSTKIGPNDYLKNLKFAVMLTGEARKGDWSIFTDTMYVDYGIPLRRVRYRPEVEPARLQGLPG